jgi:mannose-6-phosphate isomerase-like protein (cupin superfamily)
MEKINEFELKFRSGDSGIKYFHRGPDVDWGVLVLKPRETMGAHGHRQVREIFYFVEGQPKMLVNDVPYSVREGDVYRVEPGEKHDVVNDTPRIIKAIFIKCPYLPDDKITY